MFCYNSFMPKDAPKDTALCRRFCPYYKPGRNEELFCRGFLVVQGLLRKGKAISLERPERPASPGISELRVLRERVCGACGFREQDCDYSATDGAAPACGGFVLLSHLLGAGELGADDIE